MLPAREWNDNAFAHDAQQHAYRRYLAAGIAVHEHQNHFNHLFELVVCVEDEGLAQDVLSQVRDVDIGHSKRFTEHDLRGLRGRLRIRMRDPRTLLLLSRRVL